MTRSDFLQLIGMSSGALVVGVNPYALGVTPKKKKPLITDIPKLLAFAKFPVPYHVMSGDVFHLSYRDNVGDKNEVVLNLPITKEGEITFWAKFYEKGEIRFIVGDDEMYQKFKQL